ncbi:MAG: helix-turn-helix transcriptional regulator [Bacteroidetes bacterium]|nr:helix-turn-helix transcriptional regulator [Bacteroidota bacterium]
MSKLVQEDSSILKSGKIISDYVFKSDFYEIKNWAFDFGIDKNKTKGNNDCFCVVFIRNGNFSFDLRKETFAMHTGHVLIEKPDYEYLLRPATGQCSILNFTTESYHQLIDDLNLKHAFFFGNPNILSLILKASPEMEYLHYQILKNTSSGKLIMDNIIIELLKLVVNSITTPAINDEINFSSKKFHLSTIEKAKDYMNENFDSDISLFEISSYACVSPFHFSRIFKTFTSYSPHQYLQNIRIKHGEMLLKNSSASITEVSIQAGFASVEYFATAFRQKYHVSPTGFRKRYRA